MRYARACKHLQVTLPEPQQQELCDRNHASLNHSAAIRLHSRPGQPYPRFRPEFLVLLSWTRFSSNCYGGIWKWYNKNQMYLVKIYLSGGFQVFWRTTNRRWKCIEGKTQEKTRGEDMADASLRNYARDKDQIIWSSQLIISQATKLMSLALVCQRV